MATQPLATPSKFIGTTNPGSPGTFIGMADTSLIDSAKKSSPEVIAGLKNGTLKFTNDGEQQYLTDTKTGNVIQGVDLRQDMNGNLAVNVFTANGAVVQFSTSVGDDGLVKPTDTSSAFNIGINRSTGGFGGGVGGMMSIAAPALAIVAPYMIPYIAAYNSADNVSKGKYGAALLSAGLSYAGFNPDSEIVQYIKNGINIPTDSSGSPTVDTGATSASTAAPPASTTGALPTNVDYSLSSNLSNTGLNGNFGNLPTDAGSTLSNVTTGSEFTGQGLQGAPGANVNAYQPGVAGGSNVNLYQPGAINPTTGNPYTYEGLQFPGSKNLMNMNGGQGLTIPSAYGPLGADGVTVYGTGGLPTNTLTGAPLGSTLATTLTGQETAQLNVPNTTGLTNTITGNPLGTDLTNVNTGVYVPSVPVVVPPSVVVPPISTGPTAGTASVPSGGTTGSSSGPWNQSVTPGIATIGKSSFAGFSDPLKGLMGNIVPSYSPSQDSLASMMRAEYESQFNPTMGYAGGGKVEHNLDKFEPEFIEMIKKRSGKTPDHHHPNYNGSPLFRTGGSGKHVQGPGTGQSDDIPAMLADGEYVFDSDTVSALGDGSNKAGAAALDVMREAIRKHKRSAPIDKIPPKAKNPLSYLKGK